MAFTFPTQTDPATVANTLASVASLINQYIASFQSVSAVANASSGLVVVIQSPSGNAQASVPVTDPKLIAQMNAGAAAALNTAMAEYTALLDGLAAYCQLVVSNDVVSPS